MTDNPTISSLQEATKKAAEAIREKQEADNGNSNGKVNPPANGSGKPLPPKESTDGQPPAAPTDFDLKAHIKKTYGIELSDEEITNRLKASNGDSGQPPLSEKKRQAPKLEDITDEEVSKFFEKNKKEDLVKKYAANKQKEDLALVKENQRDYIKTQFPKFKDEEIDVLLNERYYIADDPKEDPYTEEEKALGQFLLKQDADRVRNGVGYQVDGVRNVLYNNAVDEYNEALRVETVNSFLTTQPKEMVLSFGKSGSIDLGEYPVRLEKETVEAVGDIMRNPLNLLTKFKVNKDDDNFDMGKMFDYLLRAELFDHVIKSAASDYYSKGVEAVENKLNNHPDLNKIRPPEKKVTKKEEEKQAEDFNRKSIEANTGRGKNIAR